MLFGLAATFPALMVWLKVSFEFGSAPNMLDGSCHRDNIFVGDFLQFKRMKNTRLFQFFDPHGLQLLQTLPGQYGEGSSTNFDIIGEMEASYEWRQNGCMYFYSAEEKPQIFVKFEE